MSSDAATLVARYEDATESQRERGRDWYPRMRRVCRRLAALSGRTVEQAAAVMAITSPRCQLSQNIARAERALAGQPVRGFAYMDRQCAAALEPGADPLAVVHGPKVEPFARAILGDTEALVLDTWALRALDIPGDKLTAADRRRADAAYREAAELVGENVRDFQAVVWIQTRESEPRADGRVNRLADIHELEV